MSVTIKLSNQDAKYLRQTLDAVALATGTADTANPPTFEVRGQRLMNRLPFGAFGSAHAFALRMGATVESALNIAEER